MTSWIVAVLCLLAAGNMMCEFVNFMYCEYRMFYGLAVLISNYSKQVHILLFFSWFDVFLTPIFSLGVVSAADPKLIDAKKCNAAASIHSSVIKDPKFPQYSQLVQLLADRGNCKLKLSEKQKGVCKKTEEFGLCCNSDYEKDLSHFFRFDLQGFLNIIDGPFFFRARECLVALVLKSSVLEGVVAETSGAIPKSIERLTNAMTDSPADTKEVYSESVTLFQEMLVSR